MNQNKLKLKQWLLPFLLLMVLVSGMSCDDSVDWKEGIGGSVFKDLETILYVGKIPEMIDKDNSVYLYYPDKTEPVEDEYENIGYFRYTIPFVALYTDGHKYKLVDETGIITDFLKGRQIPEIGFQIKLSGIIIPDEGLTFDTQYYFFKITNIKSQGE